MREGVDVMPPRRDAISHEFLPGSERTRAPYASDHFPTLAGDVLAGRRFPFLSWSASTGFTYPDAALEILASCESAAEAFFVRPFVMRPGVVFDGTAALFGSVRVAPQVQCALYRIDFAATFGDFRLAIEIDGMSYHALKADQVAADYLRQRRIVCAGYTVVRFTAQEAFSTPEECWRQVDAILSAHAG